MDMVCIHIARSLQRGGTALKTSQRQAPCRVNSRNTRDTRPDCAACRGLPELPFSRCATLSPHIGRTQRPCFIDERARAIAIHPRRTGIHQPQWRTPPGRYNIRFTFTPYLFRVVSAFVPAAAGIRCVRRVFCGAHRPRAQCGKQHPGTVVSFTVFLGRRQMHHGGGKASKPLQRVAGIEIAHQRARPRRA